jgi:hypothetical protein
MQYNQFKQIFNETIFEKSKADLSEKIANIFAVIDSASLFWTQR